MNDLGLSDIRSVEDALDGYIDDLKSYRASVREDPQLNPTAQVAFQISRALEAGEASVAELGHLAKSLGNRAFVRRAAHLSDYVGPNDEGGLNARLNALVAATATDDGEPVSFDKFKAFWAHAKTGAVFTAHPTFGISRALREIMVEIATARDEETRHQAIDRLSKHEHAPDPGITLLDEHDQAQAAIAQLQNALEWAGDQILQRAASIWPDKWKNLDIKPLSIASWVGYDLDGRTDIGWQQMVRLRLEEKVAQLHRYQQVIESIRAAIIDGDPAYGPISELCSAISQTVTRTEENVEMFPCPVEDSNALADAANALTDKGAPGHVTSVEPFVTLINQAIAQVTDDTIARRLILLRSEMKNVGLGTAHLHFRINATQLHNGFTRLLELGEEKVSPSRIQLSRLDDLIARAEPLKVNFQSLMHEGTTAIRQFILIAQILKHIDSETPIRFLIAECESAYSILIALYFARLFGVEDRIDISPLFETPSALEKGVRILEQLLDNERYHAYARLRGRIAIQTGFSDAGRFVGQIPACLAIERLQMKLARMLGTRGAVRIE
nr:phosphoenolpyruvate carboxylase [Alphaproteobacteria bacterium]